MSKEQKIAEIMWTNSKVKYRVKLLSGISIPILSLMIIERFIQGNIKADVAFLIGVGLGIILSLLIFSMAPMIRVQKPKEAKG